MQDDQQDPSASPVTARARPVRPQRPVVRDTVESAAPAPGPKAVVRTRIKVCGITSLEDAEQAVDAGAWAIGLILWRKSKRRCRIEEAQRIGAAVKRRAEVAGVFVNATLDEIDLAVDQCSLTIVQLHGDEGPSFCAEVARRTGAKVIKAARVRTGADVVALRPFHTDFHLLDTHVEGMQGGTGETFDWSLARTRRAAPGEKQPPLILSGGLRPDNVAEAVRTVRPYAVDVASGTESAPGRKDPELVTAFVREVRDAFETTEQA
ncbi:phosphoribosylanthranilate isomerase [Patulibacter minatonensis]|uniref:phosphoribosylanthranilate isomerase n=1 Tax=Patulibacter minatonensis TaxID=298163 RepID=UPI0004B75C03|nr:phosphoribosylanthranilate isomerase [Patulibacter minatonensis]